MRLPFHVLDVFTATRFQGNPLAVVLDATGLDGARMQAIAKEFNLSETVFVTQPDRAEHAARLRIFTPGREVPFAGHPTVGTAVLLAELGGANGPSGSAEALLVLEEEIGPVRVGVRLRAGRAPFAEFDAPRLPVEVGTLPAIDSLAAALGLRTGEIGFENHRPTRYSAGNAFAFIPVSSLEAIGKAQPSPQHWRALQGEGAFLYCRQTVHTGSAFHARMFAAAYGVAEDPATGSAAAAFAAVIHRFDAPTDGIHKRIIEQGYEMGRASEIELSLTIAGGRLANARIGGHAVRVMQGMIEA
jgi:trans-2,3-dihydro-3-hydroxyanthranilate isomerase